MDIENCPKCGNLYVKSALRDICEQCYRLEEDKFEIVYRFLRVRENRAATIERVAEATEVETDLLYKWVRRGRLHTAHFPNLGFPCDGCGKIIRKGKLCEGCQVELKRDLDIHETEQKRQDALRTPTYYSRD